MAQNIIEGADPIVTADSIYNVVIRSVNEQNRIGDGFGFSLMFLKDQDYSLNIVSIGKDDLKSKYHNKFANVFKLNIIKYNKETENEPYIVVDSKLVFSLIQLKDELERTTLPYLNRLNSKPIVNGATIMDMIVKDLKDFRNIKWNAPFDKVTRIYWRDKEYNITVSVDSTLKISIGSFKNSDNSVYLESENCYNVVDASKLITLTVYKVDKANNPPSEDNITANLSTIRNVIKEMKDKLANDKETDNKLFSFKYLNLSTNTKYGLFVVVTKQSSSNGFVYKLHYYIGLNADSMSLDDIYYGIALQDVEDGNISSTVYYMLSMLKKYNSGETEERNMKDEDIIYLSLCKDISDGVKELEEADSSLETISNTKYVKYSDNSICTIYFSYRKDKVDDEFRYAYSIGVLKHPLATEEPEVLKMGTIVYEHTTSDINSIMDNISQTISEWKEVKDGRSNISTIYDYNINSFILPYLNEREEIVKEHPLTSEDNFFKDSFIADIEIGPDIKGFPKLGYYVSIEKSLVFKQKSEEEVTNEERIVYKLGVSASDQEGDDTPILYEYKTKEEAVNNLAKVYSELVTMSIIGKFEWKRK